MDLTDKLIWIFLFVAIILLISFLKDTRAKNKKVIFFGDSITQSGLEPGGYIDVIKNMLAGQGINNYDLAGAGTGGDKVYDLYLRMPGDVITQSPDIVVIWIGVNDVCSKGSYDTGTDADKFEQFYRAITKQLQANNIKVMVVTPAVTSGENDYSSQQNGDLDKYAQVIRSIAKDSGLPLCDLHTLFHSYEVSNTAANANKGIFASDGMHLNDAGNRFVAEEIWKVLKDV